MKLNVSLTRSSQNSVCAQENMPVEDVFASSEYLTEKLRQDIDTSCAMQEEICGSRDNFAAATQAILNLTKALSAISENVKLLGEIAGQTNSLTINTAAEPVKAENA